jgi:hypothetical protein
MGSVTAVFNNGRIELAHPVDWPNGTQVEVTPIPTQTPRAARGRIAFPLIHSAQPGTLSSEAVRAAEEAAILQEDRARANPL